MSESSQIEVRGKIGVIEWRGDVYVQLSDVLSLLSEAGWSEAADGLAGMGVR